MISSSARKRWINTVIAIATAMSFVFGTAISATETTKVINNSALRFGNGTEDSLTGDGLLKQPFYFSQASNDFVKLTYSGYPLDMAVGFGTDGTNWNDNTVHNIGASGITPTSSSFDYSGLTDTGNGGWGVVTSSLDYTLGSSAVNIDHEYSLGETDDFIRIETTLTNKSGSLMEAASIWVGTRDDWLGEGGNKDRPIKTRGNVDESGFTKLADQTDPSNALEISTGPGGEGVLFYSVTPDASSVVDSCCSFSNVYEQNPASSGIETGYVDGSYGMYVPLGELQNDESASIVWFYAAGSAADLEDVTRSVAAAGAAEQGLDSVSSTSGVLNYEFSYDGEGYWMVVPRGATAPTGAEVVAGVDYGDVTVVSADSGAVTANTERTFDLTGLSGSTEYTVYTATVYDDPDNPGTDLTSDPESVDFVTLAEAPVINSITAGDEQVSVDISPGSTVTNFEYSIDGGSNWVTRDPVSTTSPWVITGLTNGTSYSFTFRGIHGGNPGVASAASAVTPSTVPTAPQNLQVTFGQTNGATASWSAPSSDGGDTVTGYTVQLDTGSGFETISSTGTNVTIDSVWLDQSWSVRVAANNTNGSGAYATYSNTAPVPQALADPPDNSTLVTGDNQTSITATAGQAVAGTISGGVVTPVTPTITRVTAETAADIRTETDTLITNFKNRWDGSGAAPEVVTKVETDDGAKIFGLVANPEGSTPVGVPAKDVVLVTTDDEAVMLAAIKGEKPATVNAEGSLVVETGSTIGVSINGYEPDTQGELVLMSTPTVLGTFTTDSDGSFTGQAPLPDGIAAGDHTAVVITSGKVTAFGLQLAEPFVPEPDNSEQDPPSPPAAYSGPLIAGSKQTTDSEFAVAGQETLLVVGQRLGTVSRVTIENLEAELLFVSEESFEIAIPLGLEPGTYDLQIQSSIGNLTYLQALTVKQPEPEPAQREIQSTKKINAGSFKGFVAVYALGYEGQRLSAKIGNDWVIIDPIVNNETESLARITDFTGLGVDINLRVFIDRELVMTMPLRTK